LDFISILEDEEIVANASKILKMMLNDPDKVIMSYKSYNIAKLLVYSISKFVDKSDLVIIGKQIKLIFRADGRLRKIH